MMPPQARTIVQNLEDAIDTVVNYLSTFRGVEDPVIVGVREIQVSERIPQANYWVVVTTSPRANFKVYRDGSVHEF